MRRGERPSSTHLGESHAYLGDAIQTYKYIMPVQIQMLLKPKLANSKHNM